MKAHVDQDTCIGCEMCVGICPDVFQMNSEGKSHAVMEKVPEELENGAQEAEESCPVDAISVE